MASVTPDLRLPSRLQSITALSPVPNSTAWWQRHMGVYNLPRVVAWRCTGRESNPGPLDLESDTLTSTPPSHPKLRSKVRSILWWDIYRWPTRLLVSFLLVSGRVLLHSLTPQLKEVARFSVELEAVLAILPSNTSSSSSSYSQGPHNFTDKKFPDFSRAVKTFFQNLLRVRQHLNIKTNSSDLWYIQSVIQCTNRLHFSSSHTFRCLIKTHSFNQTFSCPRWLSQVPQIRPLTDTVHFKGFCLLTYSLTYSVVTVRHIPIWFNRRIIISNPEGACAVNTCY